MKDGEIKALRKLLAALKDGKGCGQMKIRGQNDVPAECINRFWCFRRSWEICEVFVNEGLDLKKRFVTVSDSGEDVEWDVWMWVAACSAAEVARKLLSMGIKADTSIKVSIAPAFKSIADVPLYWLPRS